MHTLANVSWKRLGVIRIASTLGRNGRDPSAFHIRVCEIGRDITRGSRIDSRQLFLVRRLPFDRTGIRVTGISVAGGRRVRAGGLLALRHHRCRWRRYA